MMKFIFSIVLTLYCVVSVPFSSAQQGQDESLFYGTSWAVVIGINAYPEFPALEYAVNDAKAIESRLQRMGFNVISLRDGQATKQRILQVLNDDLPQQLEREDRLVIFYAGHGAAGVLSTGEQVGFIIPVDGRSTVDGRQLEIVSGELLVDEYATFTEKSNFISLEDIRNASDSMPAKHILYIIDGCYSGFLDPAAYSKLKPSVRIGKDVPAGQQAEGQERGLNLDDDDGSQIMPSSSDARVELTPQNFLEVLTSRDTVQVLTAGSSGEQVYEKSGHGVFTYYLLRALDGVADSNADCVVMASELGTYLKQVVPQASGFSQSPLFNRISGEGEFIFIPPRCKPIDPRDMRAPIVDRAWKKTEAYKGPDGFKYKAPTQILVDIEENLFVLDTERGQIFKFNASGTYIPEFTTKTALEMPWKPDAMAIDYSGNLWIAYAEKRKKNSRNASPGKIIIYDTQGNAVENWNGQKASLDGCVRDDGRITDFPAVALLALDHEDNLVVVNRENGLIIKCDRNGKLLRQWGGSHQQDAVKELNAYKSLTRPQGLAVDIFGYVYVADTEGHGIQKFYDGEWLPSDIPNVKGNKPYFFDRPHGLAVDNKLYLYIADTGNHRIKKYTNTGGKLLTYWGKKKAKKGKKDGEFDKPLDVALNWENSAVYVADTGNKRIQKFFLPE